MKNVLQNIIGFSPYELVISNSPQPTSVVNDNLPALSSRPTSEVIRENLEPINKARKQFVAIENSNRISHTLFHNVWISRYTKYLTGANTYYKHATNCKLHKPVKVFGQDN